VYTPAPTGEYGLRDMANEYPGSAVAPLVDGVRSVEDIVSESVATRLDVYDMLGEMIDRRLVAIARADELLARADSLALAQDHARAASLYRRLLKAHPEESSLAEKLASCLDHLGDSLEAAASYSQLALQHLAAGEGDQAFSFARRSVELSPTDPALRMALVRCLMWAKENAGAQAELKITCKLYLDRGQLEEARSTCLKILAIQPSDEDARRELARIFSRVEKDAAAEDVVVCIQCNQVNDRESPTCSKCQSPLQLTCLSCRRVVGVSDRLCIFCGADPHNGSTDRQALGRPVTSTYIKTDRIAPNLKQKGSEYWRSKLGSLAASARTHEQAGRYDEALVDWRELAQSQHDNSELQQHIRELERLAGQMHIDRQIELGNRLRRGRSFWRACKAYRGALRAMPKDDPRIGPLADILAKTEASKRRNGFIFACAYLILGIVGLLVAKPYYDLSVFRAKAVSVSASIEMLSKQGSDGVVQVDQQIAALEQRAAGFRRTHAAKARLILDDLAGSLRLAKQTAAEEEMRRIAAAIDAQDLPSAKGMIAAYVRAFADGFLSVHLHQQEERLARLEAAAADREKLLKEGPQLLERAAKREADKELLPALEDYRALTAAKDEALVAEAAKGVARLEPLRARFMDAIAGAVALAASDLSASDAALKKLEPQAASWGAVERIAEHRRGLKSSMASATEAFRGLSDRSSLADLDAFLRDHPGAAETAQVKLRIATSRKDQNLVAQDIARYRALMDSQKYEEAWKSAHDLIAMHGKSLRPDEVAYPLLIETSPAGAMVSLDDHEIGKTPFVLTCLPHVDGKVSLTLPGWDAAAFRSTEANKRWRLQVPLVRTPRWSAHVSGAVTGLQPLADGGCVVGAGTAVTAFDRLGHPQWTRTFPNDDLGDGHPRFRHPAVVLPDGRLAIGLAARGFASIDGRSGSGAVFETSVQVRGRPLLYANEVFGTQPRIAFAAESLYVGPIDAVPVAIPLATPALAGPVAITKDIDRVLAIIDLRGHLVGIEESTKSIAWDLDLQATEAGQLVQAGDLLAAILDGSRMAAIRADGAQARLVWSKKLPPPVMGDPVAIGGDLAVAAGDAVHRIGADGAARAPLALGSAPSTGASGSGRVLAVGCQDQGVRVFKDGAAAWSSPCAAAITAITAVDNAVFVGLADGSVLVLEP
jgi:tetratricopeptide (TPR) repeat protein